MLSIIKNKVQQTFVVFFLFFFQYSSSESDSEAEKTESKPRTRTRTETSGVNIFFITFIVLYSRSVNMTNKRQFTDKRLNTKQSPKHAIQLFSKYLLEMEVDTDFEHFDKQTLNQTNAAEI